MGVANFGFSDHNKQEFRGHYLKFMIKSSNLDS